MKVRAVQTASLQLVKETNQALLFNLIYQQGPVSRAELTQQTRLSPTTVSSLVEGLLRQDLVRETGARCSAASGRKPILLEVNAAGAGLLAFELTESACRCGLYNLLCQPVDCVQQPLDEPAHLGSQLAALAAELLSRHNLPPDRLAGMTIGVPGLVDAAARRILASTVVPAAVDSDLYGCLESAYPNVPVLLENESNLCACAEIAGNGMTQGGSLIYLNINRGIGAGIMQDGRLYRGSGGIAGEAGHLSIDRNGPRCLCGNRGCLEIMAGIPAIVQLAAQPILAGRPTLIRELAGGDLNRIDTAVIRQAAEQGDAPAAEILAEIAGRLACGINSIINLTNPPAVVLGGEICGLGEGFLQLLKDALAEIALPASRSRTIVRYAEVQMDAVLLGGARLALGALLLRPAVFGSP